MRFDNLTTLFTCVLTHYEVVGLLYHLGLLDDVFFKLSTLILDGCAILLYSVEHANSW